MKNLTLILLTILLVTSCEKPKDDEKLDSSYFTGYWKFSDGESSVVMIITDALTVTKFKREYPSTMDFNIFSYDYDETSERFLFSVGYTFGSSSIKYECKSKLLTKNSISVEVDYYNNNIYKSTSTMIFDRQ